MLQAVQMLSVQAVQLSMSVAELQGTQDIPPCFGTNLFWQAMQILSAQTEQF